jgi:hypothetical protein
VPSGGLPGRRSPTHQTAGLQRTIVKVCKSDCEGTIAGTRGNGEVAPIQVFREATIEPQGSTHICHSLCSPNRRNPRFAKTALTERPQDRGKPAAGRSRAHPTAGLRG